MKLSNGMAHQQGRFFKLASVKSVKTACVCIVLFFHYLKYGQSIFSRTTVLYLIAKVERKDQTFYLKHEIMLYQKEEKQNVSGYGDK